MCQYSGNCKESAGLCLYMWTNLFKYYLQCVEMLSVDVYALAPSHQIWLEFKKKVIVWSVFKHQGSRVCTLMKLDSLWAQFEAHRAPRLITSVNTATATTTAGSTNDHYNNIKDQCLGFSGIQLWVSNLHEYTSPHPFPSVYENQRWLQNSAL